jgi:hypothetical protein
MNISLSDDPDEQLRAENLLWVICNRDHLEVTVSNQNLVDLLCKHGLTSRILNDSYAVATRKGMLASGAYGRVFPNSA